MEILEILSVNFTQQYISMYYYCEHKLEYYSKLFLVLHLTSSPIVFLPSCVHSIFQPTTIRGTLFTASKTHWINAVRDHNPSHTLSLPLCVGRIDSTPKGTRFLWTNRWHGTKPHTKAGAATWNDQDMLHCTVIVVAIDSNKYHSCKDL